MEIGGTPPQPQPQTEAQPAGGEAGAGGAGGGGIEQIFAEAAAARERFTKVAVEGNTKIAEFNEKPKI